MDIAKLKSKRTDLIDLLDVLLQVFSIQHLSVDGPNAHLVVQQIELEQKNNHLLLFQKLGDPQAARGSRQRQLQSFIEHYITNCVSSPHVARFNDPATGKSGIKSAVIPIIVDESISRIHSVTSSISSLTNTEALEQVIGAYLSSTSQISDRNIANSAPQLEAGLLAAIARFEAFRVVSYQTKKTLLGAATEAMEKLNDAAERHGIATQHSEAQLSELKQRTGEALVALQSTTERHAELNRKIDAAEGAIDGQKHRFTEKFGDAEAQADAFRAAIKSATDNRDLKIYWTDRAWWAAAGMWTSWMILAALLAIVPLCLIWNSDIVISFLRGITDAVTVNVGPNPDAATLTVATVSRLVVVTIPLALYFWLIRLIVRYNMRSMLLMDDARQRATMLDTYYKMIEKGAATIEDRALVLTALMRPAPGHGPDSVEPPNFTEVLHKMKGV